jgi:hypothetical protein
METTEIASPSWLIGQADKFLLEAQRLRELADTVEELSTQTRALGLYLLTHGTDTP